MTKIMRCKGNKKGTNQPCGEKLCETDGKMMFVKLDSGRVFTVKPLSGSSVFAITCDLCGFDNKWAKQKLLE